MSATLRVQRSIAARQGAVISRRAPSLRNVGNMSLRKNAFSRTVVRAAEPDFDEGAAQVRRLLDRDRKAIDFDELESAFDSKSPAPTSAPAQEATAASDSAPSAPAGSPSPDASNDASKAASSSSASSPAVSMSSKATISPFGPASGSSSLPFEPVARKPSIEPRDLSPDMKPDLLEESTPWWTKITLTQVVIVLSFTTIIGLMIATFFVVLNMGAIRLNE